jgi:nucleoside transporter
LPNTPPHQDEKDDVNLRAILGLEAFSLFKDRAYLLFFVTSILVCIPLAFYYQHANQFLNEIGMEAAASKMALGQFSELLFLLILPLFLKRFGFKKTLIIGLLAWGVRYLLFAFGNIETSAWMLYVGILLHGICYDFFFVSGQIYTDAKAEKKNRSAAQGLITLATYGLGMFIGFRVAGALTDFYQTAQGHLWEQIWMKPSIFAFTVLILFLFTFKNQPLNKKQNE